MNIRTMKILLMALAAVALATGCDDSSGDGANGNLSVNLEPEETITDGVPDSTSPDCEDECISDGYSASFSRYATVIGFVSMSQSGNNAQDSSDVGVADFVNVEDFPELTAFNGIPTGQYTEFGYQTPLAEADMQNVNDVPQGIFDQMVDEGLSYIIEGTLTQTSSGNTIDFLIEADVAASAENCEGGGEGAEPGVNVASNSTATLTLHGDHIFFNGFPEDESLIERLAQWMWTVGEERDSDGVITREDFEAATNVEELFPQSDYDFSESPLDEINNAWDFVRAQLATQGHVNGDGECEYSLESDGSGGTGGAGGGMGGTGGAGGGMGGAGGGMGGAGGGMGGAGGGTGGAGGG